MISSERWIVMFFAICAAFMFATVLFNGILGGVFYDTDHLGDTLFMLGAGWRVHEGLTPATEFGHFYGGALEQGLGMTMKVLGPGLFTYDYFRLLLTIVLTGLAIATLYRRMSNTSLAGLISLITVLLLTSFPLESRDPIVGVASTHSYFYNRLGLIVVAIAGLYVPGIEAAARHPHDPRHQLHGIHGLVRGHELEDLDEPSSSRANQAAAFERMSRSIRS